MLARKISDKIDEITLHCGLCERTSRTYFLYADSALDDFKQAETHWLSEGWKIIEWQHQIVRCPNHAN